MGLNSKAVMNVQRQIDTLSDGHQDIVDQAVFATEGIITMDERRHPRSGQAVPIFAKSTKGRLDALSNLLLAHAERAHRVKAEIDQIRQNLKID